MSEIRRYRYDGGVGDSDICSRDVDGLTCETKHAYAGVATTSLFQVRLEMWGRLRVGVLEQILAESIGSGGSLDELGW